ncbi:MAG TPA: M3 family metallopeptidase, partial [Bacteroidia bacterium]|nr:M3 family metallopeptidase [Bacteroidia bacterium]
MKQIKITSLLSVSVVLILSSCGNKSKQAANNNNTMSPNNPFAKASTLPFQTADFTNIKDSDFKPAIEEGIKEQLAEVKTIAENPDAPTFENTLVAMEKSGLMLRRVNNVFNLLSGANTNPVLDKVSEDVAPDLAAANDAIFLNARLFIRVEAIYNQREQLKLDPEAHRLIEFYYQHFVLSGANLSDKDRDSLKKLNAEDASLEAKYTNQLRAAAKAGALAISDSNELAGLSPSEMESAASAAKAANMPGKWLLTLKNTTQQPLLSSLKVRATREKLFEASINRAEKGDSNDTRALISHIARLRAEKAKLIGFPNYASLTLMDQMAKKPENVEQFFAKLVPAATARAKMEASDIQKVIDAQKGGFQVQPWDWDFYSEQVRKAKYDLDESQVKPYFVLDSVLKNGVFYAANQLYGLTFKQRTDLPVYNPDVKVFEVFDKDGTSMALFYCDYFKRDNKNGGAWMANLVDQSKLLGTKPVIYNICNFTKPAEGQPALISFDDVVTMFHEFGHGLHGIFADEQYVSISGTSTARDFVEFPSQFNEHWASDPQVFKNYAKHYKTGELMPQELVDKLKKAATFNKGYDMTELIAAAALDIQWHEITADMPLQNVDTFEVHALRRTGLDLPQVPPRYRSSYF